MLKKNILMLCLSIGIILLSSGCSSRAQINPDPSTYSESKLEKSFDNQKTINKKLKQEYNKGVSAGYNQAKNEIKKLIPYLESLRASAELREHKGLCLPPIFLDKSNKSNVKIIVGKAHICDNFSLNNIFNIMKNRIPGLPDYVIKKSSNISNTQSNKNESFASNISIDGEKKQKAFIQKPAKIELKKVKIKNTFTNRKILRDSNYQFSNVDSQDNYLIVEFNNIEDENKFCNTFKICIK